LRACECGHEISCLYHANLDRYAPPSLFRRKKLAAIRSTD
jgi:hypothetical protein